MRSFLEFIKTTVLGGLLVIVPISIILFVVGRIVTELYLLATEFVGQLPLRFQNEALLVAAITLLALVGLCFVTGLLVRTRLGIVVKRWFGRNVGNRIPMFNAIVNVTRRVVGIKGTAFTPVEVDLYGTDARTLGFLVERLPDRRCTVFIPSAPVATIGNVVIVPQDKLTELDASVTDTVGAITQWGVDTHKLYGADSQDKKNRGTENDAAATKA